MDIVQYVRARSLDEAWELNQKKTAVVLGGCCWLRLSARRPIPTAIDLLGLGLDKIEETEQEYRLGAMVSLHEMELSAELDTYTCGALREAVRHIVGVQFRRMATLGGSICGRFGFSDVLTLFLVLDAEVELYHGGRQKLADFARTGAGRDILTHVLLPKRRLRAAYTSLRLSAADFPVLACAQGRGVQSSCREGQSFWLTAVHRRRWKLMRSMRHPRWTLARTSGVRLNIAVRWLLFLSGEYCSRVQRRLENEDSL